MNPIKLHRTLKCFGLNAVIVSDYTHGNNRQYTIELQNEVFTSDLERVSKATGFGFAFTVQNFASLGVKDIYTSLIVMTDRS